MHNNTILEFTPAKNILYYFSKDEYFIINHALNNWDRNLGKCSVSKIVEMFKEQKWFKSYGLFQNVKKEEKIREIPDLKGYKPNCLIEDEVVDTKYWDELNKKYPHELKEEKTCLI